GPVKLELVPQTQAQESYWKRLRQLPSPPYLLAVLRLLFLVEGIFRYSGVTGQAMHCSRSMQSLPRFHARNAHAYSPSWNQGRPSSAASAPRETWGASASQNHI